MKSYTRAQLYKFEQFSPGVSRWSLNKPTSRKVVNLEDTKKDFVSCYWLTSFCQHPAVPLSRLSSLMSASCLCYPHVHLQDL